MSKQITYTPASSIDPDKLAMMWVEHLLQELRLAFLTNANEIELKQPFNVKYLKYKWVDALTQANRICEQHEQYEHCAEILQMQSKLSTNNKINLSKG